MIALIAWGFDGGFVWYFVQMGARFWGTRKATAQRARCSTYLPQLEIIVQEMWETTSDYAKCLGEWTCFDLETWYKSIPT